MSERELEPDGTLADPILGPAAHSMDTDWFAVDGLGHVGVFESGEGGGVPEAHYQGWENQSSFSELLELLLGEPASSGLRFDDHELFRPDDRRGDPWDAYTIAESREQLGEGRGYLLLELDHPQSISHPQLGVPQPDFERAIRLPSDRVLVRGWFEYEQIARLWWELGILRVRTNYDIEPARLGVFRYSCDDYSAGPYVRIGQPRHPLRREQLSSRLREALANVAFTAVDFRKHEFVQPFEHLPSHAWGGEWLGTDGEMHTIG
ncbi:hypothetical protein ACNOYE_00710 [Nannocystaceae bacterium ST9]